MDYDTFRIIAVVLGAPLFFWLVETIHRMFFATDKPAGETKSPARD